MRPIAEEVPEHTKVSPIETYVPPAPPAAPLRNPSPPVPIQGYGSEQNHAAASRTTTSVGVFAAAAEVNALCQGFAGTHFLESAIQFQSRYVIGEVIGAGGYATVFQVSRHPDVADPSRAASTTDGRHAYSSHPHGSQASRSQALAVKMMDKTALGGGDALRLQRAMRHVRDECRVLSELSHRHVIRMVEIFEAPERVYIVMERALGGALFDRIAAVGAFSERRAAEVMQQLMDVLAYMHSHGVIHRDIKPDNILLETADGWSIKVTDFGMVKIFSEEASLATSLPRGTSGPWHESPPAWPAMAGAGGRASTSATLDRCESRGIGSPFYRAPEQAFCFPPYPTTYGAGVDVWAAGVVCYNLLSGQAPFDELEIPPPPIGDHGQLSFDLGHDSISHGHRAFGSERGHAEHGCGSLGPLATRTPLIGCHSFPAGQWSAVSAIAKELITLCLSIDPRRRPSAAAMLAHPWLQLPRDGVSTAVLDAAAGESPLSSSYKKSFLHLVGAAKRAREVEAANRFSRHNSIGSSVDSSVGSPWGGHSPAASLPQAPAHPSFRCEGAQRRRLPKVGRRGGAGDADAARADVAMLNAAAVEAAEEASKAAVAAAAAAAVAAAAAAAAAAAEDALSSDHTPPASLWTAELTAPAAPTHASMHATRQFGHQHHLIEFHTASFADLSAEVHGSPKKAGRTAAPTADTADTALMGISLLEAQIEEEIAKAFASGRYRSLHDTDGEPSGPVEIGSSSISAEAEAQDSAGAVDLDGLPEARRRVNDQSQLPLLLPEASAATAIGLPRWPTC